MMLRILFFFSVIITSFSFSEAPFGEDPKGSLYLEKRVVVSPNPASSYTKVMTKNTSTTIRNVEVYSFVNELEIQITPKFSSNNVELNVYKLKNGKYFVKVFLSDGSREIVTLIKRN